MSDLSLAAESSAAKRGAAVVVDLTLDEDSPSSKKHRRRPGRKMVAPIEVVNLCSEDEEGDDVKIAAVSSGDSSTNDFDFAQALQEEYLASSAQLELDQLAQQADSMYAYKIQAEFDQQSKEQEDAAMQQTNSGKAWKFVERLLKLYESKKSSLDDSFAFGNVATDDMVFLTERMLDIQDIFCLEGKPTHVDVGYHYTRNQNLDHIRTVRQRSFLLVCEPPMLVLSQQFCLIQTERLAYTRGSPVFQHYF